MEEEEYIKEVVKEISKIVPDSYNKIELCKKDFKGLSDSYVMHEEHIKEVIKETSKVPDSYNKIELCKEDFKGLSDSYVTRGGKYHSLLPHDVPTEDRNFYIYVIELLNSATLALRLLIKCEIGVVYNHGESTASIIRLDSSKPLNGIILNKVKLIQEHIEDIRRIALSIYYSEEATSKHIYEHFLKYFIGSFPDYLTNNYKDYNPYFTDSTYSNITKLRPRV